MTTEKRIIKICSMVTVQKN